jgi:ferritin-like metal-binding protein YciE
MAIKTMHDMFIDELRDIFHAENQLIKALPKMAKAATNPQLKQGFETHLEETRRQVERLEQVFDELDTRKRGQRCEAMEGLIEEGKELIETIQTPEVLDVALIIAAQKVEHYEIAAYGSLHALAQTMGLTKVADLLEQTLNEEKATDQKLNELALRDINRIALQKAA